MTGQIIARKIRKLADEYDNDQNRLGNHMSVKLRSLALEAESIPKSCSAQAELMYAT